MIGEQVIFCFLESGILGILNEKIGFLRAKDKDLILKK